MVNHFRTLLINRAAAGLKFVPGYEHVDPTFREIPEPDAVRHARRQLFGGDPDSWMLHYRARQLLRVVESSRLADHIALYDPRITTDSETEWPNSVFGAVVTSRLAGTRDPSLTGSQESPDASGVCAHSYDIEFQPPDTVIVIDRLGQIRVEQTVVTADDVAEPVPLPGSGYSAACPADGSGRWLVQVVNRPVTGPVEWLTGLESLSHERTMELFGNTTIEPNLTWWNLWNDGETPVDRLSAIVLAMVASLESRRVA